MRQKKGLQQTIQHRIHVLISKTEVETNHFGHGCLGSRARAWNRLGLKVWRGHVCHASGGCDACGGRSLSHGDQVQSRAEWRARARVKARGLLLPLLLDQHRFLTFCEWWGGRTRDSWRAARCKDVRRRGVQAMIVATKASGLGALTSRGTAARLRVGPCTCRGNPRRCLCSR